MNLDSSRRKHWNLEGVAMNSHRALAVAVLTIFFQLRMPELGPLVFLVSLWWVSGMVVTAPPLPSQVYAPMFLSHCEWGCFSMFSSWEMKELLSFVCRSIPESHSWWLRSIPRAATVTSRASNQKELWRLCQVEPLWYPT